jgi:predicted enzyme related to lactoylglutathione lyase
MSGNITYFEVPSSDIEATQRFWGSLFGWEFREGNFPGYSMIDGPTPMGGAPHEETSQRPRIFFAVDDINAAVVRCVRPLRR